MCACHWFDMPGGARETQSERRRYREQPEPGIAERPSVADWLIYVHRVKQ